MEASRSGSGVNTSVSGAVPWAWIWFVAAVLAFAMGYLLRDQIAALFKPKAHRKTKKHHEEDLPPQPPPQDGVTGMCVFEDQDTMMHRVFDYKGKRVAKGTTVSCSECNQYVFRDSDGCVPYTYDNEEKGNVCMVGEYLVQSCTSNKDCGQGQTCQSGKCTPPVLTVPDSMTCPF